MSRVAFRAMGTTISLLLPTEQAWMGARCVHALFVEWEQRLSRFIPDNELMQLNRHAGTAVIVSELLYTVLETALQAARATAGLYDPTMLRQLVRLGYDRSFDELPVSGLATCVSEQPGGSWRAITLDPFYRLVRMPAGTQLDLGGIVKGMAVDAAVEQLRRQGIATALVNAGGDLRVLGTLPKVGWWSVAVPGRDGFWTIPLRAGAVATSGIAHRHWQQDGVQRHHLLDPRTGLPAQNDLWSVTVVADRCEQAEVAAKVAFISGAQAGADFLRRHAIAGLLVHQDGTWETVEPWPADGMKCEGSNE